MSGHNKFSKIKHKKVATDAQKSKLYGKIGKLLTVEAKKSGGIESPSLKAAIDKAKTANVPKDIIERAIKKGSGTDVSQMESITYEAYGPGGSAIIIEALTDNRNKASAEVKHILSKNGFALAAPGSAVWAFEKDLESYSFKPTTTVELSEEDAEKLNDLVEQLEDNDEVQDVYTNAL